MDAGDFGQPDNPRVPGGWDVTEYAAKTLGEIGCDAWTPGERELLHGPDKLKQLVAAFKTPVVSANIQVDGKKIFDEKVIKKVGGVTVGITGITAPEVLLDGKGITASGEEQVAHYELGDPVRALKSIVATLQKRCDVVVVLAHMAPPEARRLAEEVPGIDVLVIGHVPGSGYDGERVGDTWVIRTGQRGQMVTFLNMTVAGGAVASAKGIFEDLGPTMPHDADLQTRTALFDQQIKSMRDKVGPRAPTQ